MPVSAGSQEQYDRNSACIVTSYMPLVNSSYDLHGLLTTDAI